jgi:2-(1,2-epoxy-1,2-dihydrophenyl)acetyl-CoA isomerase
MSDDVLLFERDGAIARLTLNRPNAGNALSIPLCKALMEAAIVCDEDDTIRCVVITGAGKLFCGGGDLAGMVGAGDKTSSWLKEVTAYFHAAVARLARMPKPLLTLVNGPAAGAGVSLAVLGDIAIAGRAANFTLAYTGIGLCPDGGSTWLLPRLVGLRRAQELVLLNKRVGAEEAAQIGLVTRVVDDAALGEEGAAAAQTLASSATLALGGARQLLVDSFSNGFETQMELESRTLAELSKTPHAREAIAAFTAKRKPKFD